MQKVNKGEWSEFYTFVYVLATGKLFAADEDLNKINNQYYSILSALKHEIEYVRDPENSKIIFEENENIFEVPISKFLNNLNRLFQKIKEGTGTFSIPEIEPLINDLKINNIKESSKIKGDIRLRIYDELNNLNPIHSFSIKSYVGGAPTLLNASKGTIFTYKIEPSLDINDVNALNRIYKDRPRGWLNEIIKYIDDKKLKLKPVAVSNDVFKRNLEMIDFRMPEIIASILAAGYLVENKNLNLATEYYLNNWSNEPEYIIKYKVKELLTASALGMVPVTEWDGMDHANGGYIVVKEDGEVLCYHLFERNKLKEYLYNNTRFETPSTSRYDIGKIYQRNNEWYIDLALQIRF